MIQQNAQQNDYLIITLKHETTCPRSRQIDLLTQIGHNTKMTPLFIYLFS